MLLTFVNLSLETDYSSKISENLNEGIPCTIVGSSGMKLYTSNKLLFRSYNGKVLTTKISGAESSSTFTLDYCECYKASGACRISLTAQDNKSYYKLILGLILEGYDVLKDKTSKSVFIELQKSKRIKERSYCKVQHELYLSPIFVYDDHGNASYGHCPRFTKPKDIVTGSTERTFRFPLIYKAEASYGKIRDKENGKEYPFAEVGYFKIDSVVECASKYYSFSSTTVHNTYMRKDHDPYSEYVPCNWDPNYVDTNSNQNVISKDGQCGSAHGRCPDNKCCSKYGYCGTTDEYCKSGCRPEYGICKN
ncbi:carbohydrate-binding module family 18 protein [Piromyces sp. E2]|nr:carbohydrate-binding module family 18 protein [Piromyces sp. E2]|eukprot:OUM59783.1 carbohydrate-binding module family 18 protein [Piromyces sp. E2]